MYKYKNWKKVLDALMLPVMYVLQGTLSEIPQKTHAWNNRALSAHEALFVQENLTLCLPKDVKARLGWFFHIPRLHMPIFGGWRRFLVIEPKGTEGIWFVGWVINERYQLSELPLCGPVRLLAGNSDVPVFGFSKKGHQIQLHTIGEGEIGRAGMYAKIPLL